jgi:hypothetical protein
MSFVMACYINNNFGSTFGVQRNNVLKATIPHTENKARASKANASVALFFFFEDEDEEVEDAADPLAVPLPEDVPLAVPCGEAEEGLAVGAGDATLKECQIGCREQEPKRRDTDYQEL